MIVKLEEIIIYEDDAIIVVHKPAGVATQSGRVGQQDMVSLLTNYLAKKNGSAKPPFVGLIHRLDQPVEGVLVFAKTKEATKELNAQLTAGYITKRYYAAFDGSAKYAEGTIVDFLRKDNKTNTSSICDPDTPDAKKAILEYRVISENKEKQISLADIHLVTGRHHQIRVQMAGAKMGLLGDQKYASEEAQEHAQELGIRSVALCSYSLAFTHPKTHKEVEYKVVPKGDWYKLFDVTMD